MWLALLQPTEQHMPQFESARPLNATHKQPLKSAYFQNTVPIQPLLEAKEQAMYVSLGNGLICAVIMGLTFIIWAFKITSWKKKARYFSSII